MLRPGPSRSLRSARRWPGCRCWAESRARPRRRRPARLPPGLAEHPDYEILRELGRGGMGVVYLAENRLMGRKEVLKVVSSHLINRHGVLDRFLREIRSAAQLHHPNIVTAYSAIRLGESLVFAMEYVEGLDLAKLVKARGPLPVAHACYFVHQAALGLQHAHERGMVHRDIKPGNLMLAREGNRPIVKILDFGLAKVTSEGPVDGGLTREGQMLGTPDYIAPEQIRRRPAGRHPRRHLQPGLHALLPPDRPARRSTATSLYDLFQAHHSMDAKPLNLVRPEVPVELAAVVAKMMAKEPERRFQTPAEVAQALTPFFKKGNVASTGSKPELSQVGRPDARQATAATGSVPTRPATEFQPAPASSVRKPVETPRPESMWKSLIDFTETEPVEERCAGRRFEFAVHRGCGRRWPPGCCCSASWSFRRWFSGVKTSKPTPELPKDDDADSTLTNSIGMTLKLIPAGTFLMGSPDDGWHEDETSATRVRITRPFYLGVYEVTQAQYEAVMGNNPSYFSATGEGKDRVAGQSTDQYPVETVSWLDAVKFCNKLERDGGTKAVLRDRRERTSGFRTGTGRATVCRRRPSGNTRARGDPADLKEHAWFDKNSGDVTHPVGKRPNRFGLHDMHGNVAEWCWDGLRRGLLQAIAARRPDRAGLAGAASRVFRGGSWLDDPRYCRSARP